MDPGSIGEGTAMDAGTSSALRKPLDDILGARANVQILRVLTRGSVPLGRAEAARRAGLTPQGGRKALDRLFDVGIIDYVGTGSTQQVRLRTQHPLAPALIDLFDAEAEHYRGLVRGIEDSVAQLPLPPRAVWIEGPVAEGADEYGDPLVVGLLGTAGEVDELSEELRGLLVGIEKEYDVTIEVRPYTEGDLGALPPGRGTTIPLLGPEPAAFVSVGATGEAPSIRRHEDHDARTRRRAAVLADLLVTDPGLRDRALEWLERRLEAEEANRELREWKRILESTSVPRLRRLLTAESDRAVRLRQSLPFWPVLSAEERQRIVARADDDS